MITAEHVDQVRFREDLAAGSDPVAGSTILADRVALERVRAVGPRAWLTPIRIAAEVRRLELAAARA